MTPDQNDQNPTTIYTDGGPAISGPVNTGGGDFVARDKIIQTEEIAYTVDGLTNPYLGLRAFGYEDHSIYGGREQLAQEVVDQLTDPKAPQTLLFINGASGSGKSSFVQAGLLPLLERHYADQQIVRHAIFRPSTRPLVMLWDALRKLGAVSQPAAFDQATFVPDLTTFPAGQVRVLVVDQFEELFIQSAADQRDQFIDFLNHLPPFAASHTHILATLRVDYLDELFAVQPLWAIATAGIPLRAMRAADLRHAIQKPIQVNHPTKRFAPDLLDRLVQDAGDDAALLPLLQVTLAELWKKGRLISANYRSLTDAIHERADTVINYRDYDRTDPQQIRPAEEQTVMMAVLLDLIHVSVDDTDRRDVRQRRTRAELTRDSAQRASLIEALVNARLISATTEIRESAAVEVIDIIHESLIDNWERLRTAIDEQRQQLQRRARFQLWLGEWSRNGRQNGYLLLTDMQLAEVRALVEAQDIEVQGEKAQAFYRQSVEWREAEQQKELQQVRELAEAQRQRAQVFRNGVIVAGLLFLLAATAAGISYYLNGELSRTNSRLQTTANIAFSRQLAVQSTSELNKNRYEPSILLAVESGRITDTFESFSAIRSAISNPWHSQFVFYGAITQAKWNQDGNKILTGQEDGSVRIWNATNGQELYTFDLHPNRIYQLTWSKDETKILTHSILETVLSDAVTGQVLSRITEQSGGSDNNAIWSHDESKVFLCGGICYQPLIWDVVRNTGQVRLEGHTGDVTGAAWSHDDARILTYGQDNTARVWNTANGIEVTRLKGHTNLVSTAVWSKDESRILTGSYDNTARIWNAVTGDTIMLFKGHTGGIYQVSWSQDETKILTASADNTARLWDGTTGKELKQFKGPTDSILRAVWNQHETQILTNGIDSAVRIWDAVTGSELANLDGHTKYVTTATWSHDAQQILTTSDDGMVRIWDLTGQERIRLEGHEGSVSQATWDSDEHRILTTSVDGTARIWDVDFGNELVRFDAHNAAVSRAVWSHDNSKILTYSDDNTVRLWDATSGQKILILNGHNNDITYAAWNQDESKILTASADGTVRIWNAATGRELFKLDDHTTFNIQTTWNHDETKILTCCQDFIIRIWDAISGQELLRFAGHTDLVAQAIWNQDETRILSSSADGTVRIWNAATGQELLRIGRLGDQVAQAIWNQDETKILTVNNNMLRQDFTIRILDLATSQELTKFTGHTAMITKAIWNQKESQILTTSDDGTIRIWDATTGIELIRFNGYTDTDEVKQAIWNRDETKILAVNNDLFGRYPTVRILDATSKQKLVSFEGHTGYVYQATWSRDDSRILTSSADSTVRIWDASTGNELVRLEGHKGAVRQATWSQDESKILTASDDGTVRIWYTHMSDLLVAACQWTPRNFTWAEWSTYMADTVGAYRPTCPNAPIPPDAIAGIEDEARQLIRAGQRESAVQRLEELNGWLQVNGQFKSFGADVDAFVAEVSATMTPVAS